ncbi:C40 family peptidase [Luteibaculum oceani]|uniref:NlpC/P60 family protein n=1 Tax=Luteibaculum oceani TaxID=1294296 RepID=A0A5C6VKD1_9FLAO|nr:C40 family peptidase [Luteibaculum oceani]TXC85084.1 NlpC/P60 family protein [Luteibaculum oceani]
MTTDKKIIRGIFLKRLSLLCLAIFLVLISQKMIGQEGYELSLEEAIDQHPRQILTKYLLDTSNTFIGVPYRYGADGPNHFDCSGFVRYVFQSISLDLPRSSGMIANTGKSISREKISVGDLIIFAGRNKTTKTPGHVGIVSEIRKNQIIFIHASTSSGVRTDSLYGHPYFEDRILDFRTWEW